MGKKGAKGSPMQRGDGQLGGQDPGEGLALGEGPLARRHKYQNSRSFTPLSDSVAAWGVALGREFQPPPTAPATAPRAATAARASVTGPLTGPQVGALPARSQQESSYRHGQTEVCPQGDSSAPVKADISSGPGHPAASSRHSSAHFKRQEPWGRTPQIDAERNHQAAQTSQHRNLTEGSMQQPQLLPAEPPAPSSPSGTARPASVAMHGSQVAATGSGVTAEEVHQQDQGSWGRPSSEASFSQPEGEPLVPIKAVMAALRNVTATSQGDRSANTDTAGVPPLQPPRKTAPMMSSGTSS